MKAPVRASAWMHRRIRLLAALRPVGASRLAVLAFVLLVQALQPAVAAIATGALVSSVAGPAAGPASWVAPLALLGGSLLVGQLADLFGSALRAAAARRIDGAQRTTVSASACAAPGLAVLEDPALRDDLQRASARPSTHWTESTPGQAAVAQLRLAFRVVQAVTCSAVLVAASWWLVLLMLAAVLGTRSVLSRSTRTIAQVISEGAPAARRERYWRDQVISPGSAKEIRVFGLQNWVAEQRRAGYLALVEPVWRRSRDLTLRQWAAFAVLAATALTGFAVLGLAAVRGTVSTGSLGAMLAAVIGLLSLATSDHDTVVAAGGAPAVHALDRLQARLGPTPAPAASPVPATGGGRDTPPLVRFEAVRFTYPGADRPILDGCDLEIRPGEVLGLVGSNGAGKSTLTKLLAGLYQPQSGRITADGADIADLPPAVWHRQLAPVFQDFIQYHLPARDNISLGAPDAPCTDADLAAVADAAGSTDIVDRLPAGWDTPLSATFSGGTDLSGGQWQHMALTRAMFAVRSGARILVLDEPTAHLDVRTELEFFRRVVHGLRNVSVVMISHRLSTVLQADRIVCLADGRVAESGTHEDLLARNGVYATLFAEQASDRATLQAGATTAEVTQ